MLGEGVDTAISEANKDREGAVIAHFHNLANALRCLGRISNRESLVGVAKNDNGHDLSFAFKLKFNVARCALKHH